MTAYFALWTGGCVVGFFAGMLTLRARGSLCIRSTVALLAAVGGLFVGARVHYRLTYLPFHEAIWLTYDALLAPGRLPLGFAVGGLVGVAVSKLLLGRWRETGDALAVAGMSLIAVGRIGCLLNGCCSGTVCAAAWPWCVTYGRSSEAYGLQLKTNLITQDQLTSLPFHPLPVYFGLAAFLTLAIMIVMLRRGTPPGSLLLVACMLRPASKLMLEPLRQMGGGGGPDRLTVLVPAVTLVCSLTIVAAIAVRSRVRRTREAVHGS